MSTKLLAGALKPIPNQMMWFWERGSESIRLETRVDDKTREYLVILRLPNGERQIERFADLASFRVRLATLEEELKDDHWKHQSGGRVSLIDSWPEGR